MKKEGKSNLRISFLLLVAVVIATCVCYGYNLWATTQAERAKRPQLAIEIILKGLRTHHSQVGRFPANFIELEERVWRSTKKRDFGEKGRELTHQNYHYIYHSVNERIVTLWAIPVGPFRDEVSTHFLLITPDAFRRWKGAALTEKDCESLPVVPAYAQLAVLGLTEQQPMDLKKLGGGNSMMSSMTPR